MAFSAFTDFGPIMALAIALHNIPEGVIIAAPIYAATNSRWKAIGLATASVGASEGPDAHKHTHTRAHAHREKRSSRDAARARYLASHVCVLHVRTCIV